MTIEIYMTTPPIIAAAAACNVEIVGVPSTYNTEDEDEE